jgi:hypothetical protein
VGRLRHGEFPPQCAAAIADVLSNRPFVDVRRDEEIRTNGERAEWPGKPFAASPAQQSACSEI